jgi:hypothetical protein
MSQEVQEDGIVKKNQLKQFEVKTFEKRTVEFGTSAFPLDLYGGDSPSPVGYKITDVFGGMGVVCKIHPDDKEQ